MERRASLSLAVCSMFVSALALGCGGDVSTTPSGAGGGAGGGDATSSTASTNSTSSTASTNSTNSTASSAGTGAGSSTSSSSNNGGAGGIGTSTAGPTTTTAGPTTTSTSTGIDPDACKNACQKLQNECKQPDACQGASQLDCTQPLAQCVAECINTSPCGSEQACFDKCDTTNVQGCVECSGSKCQQAAFACFQNPACQTWIQCAQACAGKGDPSCYDACDAANPAAKTQYDALYTCQCKNCSAECIQETDPCNK